MLIRLFALSGLLLCPLAVLAEDTPAAVAPAAGTSMPDAPVVEAPKAFETEGVELYIKKDIMAQRASNDDLAAYTKALQGVADDYFTAQKDPWREDLDIVVAIKPGPIARVWPLGPAGQTGGRACASRQRRAGGLLHSQRSGGGQPPAAVQTGCSAVSQGMDGRAGQGRH